MENNEKDNANLGAKKDNKSAEEASDSTTHDQINEDKGAKNTPDVDERSEPAEESISDVANASQEEESGRVPIEDSERTKDEGGNSEKAHESTPDNESVKSEKEAPERKEKNGVIEEPNKEGEEKQEPEVVESNETTEVSSGGAQDGDGGEEEEEEEHQLDYSNYTKPQMVQVLETLLKQDDYSQAGRILKEIKGPFDEIVEHEKEEAYKKYLEEGGEKDGFEYRGDELDQRFLDAYNKLRERKTAYFNSLEIQKEENLKKKQETLEKLRELVDSEETGASIKDLKELQTQWKEIGPVPSSQVKSLWANYNALLDRFYDNRSIYFELKELDRKKNYDLKIELCEKAEQLANEENIREAIKHLNELHEEFKHIGPVPKEDQEPVWQRFKAASDSIYAKRKDFYEKLREEQKVNQVAKEALAERVISFAEFDSEKISDWNKMTKEIISIQKEWESIGSLPKDKAKKINKKFWSSFKAFFNNKGAFFKKIDEQRQDNLKLKQELLNKAESLKDSDDFKNTAEELKKLQRQWKEIGPVPEKFRNEVFKAFKKACDHFFNRRRANSEVIEKEYEENLKTKQKLCEELESMVKNEEIDVSRVKSIEEEWGNIGFVPRKSIKSIQRRYTNVIEEITEQMDVSEEEKTKLRFKAQFNNMNFGPGSEKFIQKKENALRRQISNLENDIGLWRNNIDFFASSKNADKLKKEFEVKIDKANEQLKSLKEQLKVISNI
jgi:hypothetical protein